MLDFATLDMDSARELPVLDNHRTGSARDQVGRVESLRVDGDKLVAVLRLSGADDAAPVVQRVAEGTLNGVSIGYRVPSWREGATADGRVRSPARWELFEVTLTPTPADPNARLRSNPESEDTMTVENQPAGVETRKEIRGLVRSAGLPPEIADDLIDQGADMTAAKAAVFDAMDKRRGAQPIIRTHAAQNDDPAVIRRRQEAALAFRMGTAEIADDARPYLNATLRDMASDSLSRRGVSTRGMSADEIFARSAEHGSSDFPLIVSNAAGKVAAEAYQAAESPLKALCRQRRLPNFKESTSVRLGEIGRLEKLDESGEITHATRAEAGETLHLDTFARQISVGRKLLINDDLGLLGDMTRAFAEAAAQTEADLIVGLLTSNPVTGEDGKAVFHADHGNVGTAGDISETTLDEARQALRTIKGLDGKTVVGAPPRFLVVGPDRELEAEKLLAAIQPDKAENANPFAGSLRLLVEPRVSGAWYVFADPARMATLQYAYLASAPGVQIQRAENFDTLGLRFRAFLDFGAGWAGWRGAFRNAGS